MKKLIAVFMACMVVLSTLAVPSFATDYQSTYNFWNWAYDNSWFLGKAIIGFAAGNVCQVSEDGMHHATTHSSGFAGGGRDGERVYNCVCDLCGQEFQAVATDLEQSYNTVIENDNYCGITSDNGIYLHSNWEVHETQTTSDVWTTATTDFWYYPDADVLYNIYRRSYNTDTTPHIIFRQYFTFDYPVYLVFTDLGGFYKGKSQGAAKFSGVVKYRSREVFVGTHYECESNTEYYIEYKVEPDFNWSSSYYPYNVYTFIDFPQFYFIPYSGNSGSSVVDRPFTFSPTFSYVDEGGNSVTVDKHIIDETNLTYYNPVTNTTTNIQNWSYDYSDRSYTVLTDSNNTTTITYSDEYITINEGDNITYNIYYSDPQGSGGGSDNSGSGDDGGDGILGGLGDLLGTALGGLIRLISGVISGLIDSLIDLVEMTIEKLGQVVNLFGSFGDALKAFWSWLPEEIVTILAAGVSVVVFASVIKLFV